MLPPNPGRIKHMATMDSAAQRTRSGRHNPVTTGAHKKPTPERAELAQHPAQGTFCFWALRSPSSRRVAGAGLFACGRPPPASRCLESWRVAKAALVLHLCCSCMLAHASSKRRRRGMQLLQPLDAKRVTRNRSREDRGAPRR